MAEAGEQEELIHSEQETSLTINFTSELQPVLSKSSAIG